MNAENKLYRLTCNFWTLQEEEFKKKWLKEIAMKTILYCTDEYACSQCDKEVYMLLINFKKEFKCRYMKQSEIDLTKV